MSSIGRFCKFFEAYWSYIVFCVLLLLSAASYLTHTDMALHKWIMAHQSLPWLQRIYGILSQMGQLEFKLVIGFGMMAYFTWVNYQPQWRMFWWRAVLVISATGAFIIPLKHIFGRPRPKMLRHDLYEFNWFETASNMHSYPSGHTTTTWAFFFFLSRYWPKLTPVWLLYALSASYARMGIGSHYLADVLAGIAIGYFMAYWMWPKVAPKALQRRLPSNT